MHIHNVKTAQPQLCWSHSELDLQWIMEHRHEPELVVNRCDLRVHYESPHHHQLNEATYKELVSLIDGSFLGQAQRMKALQYSKLAGIEGDTMIFDVPSSEFEDNRIVYKNLVQFDMWDELGHDDELTAPEKARLLLWVSNIRLFCSCPSQLYHGYQYLLTVVDSAIYPETRKPVIRNPHERGICCKHLSKTLSVLVFHLGDIAKEIKSQFG